MATIALGALSYVGNVNGAATQVQTGLKEANSQSFKRGELVNIVNGAVQRPASTALVGSGDETLDISDHIATTANPTEHQISGIALRDATNVTSGNVEVHVQLLRSGDIVEGNLISGTDGDNPGNVVSALADVGDAVSIVFDGTNNKWYFSTTTAECVGYIYRNNLAGGRGVIGDTNARVHVVLRGSILQMG